MTYQPLAEVRKTLRVKWYRSKVDPATLRHLSKRSDLQGWFQAGGHLVLWLLTGSCVYFFWIKLNPLAEFLYWRMNWHIEHHMFAGVPCYNLKKLHRLIAEDMPELRTLLGAWREMRETWQRQKADPDYFYDTPLPPTAKHIPAETPDALESSIGELAPRGLK